MATYEDEIICDMAETYNVYDIGGLPLDVVARLVFGLGANSRLQLKLAGQKHTNEEMILALIYDRLSEIAWSRCKSGTPKPKSLYESMTGKEQTKKRKNVLFSSIDEFEEARRKIIEGSVNE